MFLILILRKKLQKFRKYFYTEVSFIIFQMMVISFKILEVKVTQKVKIFKRRENKIWLVSSQILKQKKKIPGIRKNFMKLTKNN